MSEPTRYAEHHARAHQLSRLKPPPAEEQPAEAEGDPQGYLDALGDLPPLPGQATHTLGLATVDAKGRVPLSAARGPLGWEPGQPVSVDLGTERLVVREAAEAEGGVALASQSRLGLSQAEQVGLGVRPGGQVLLVVDPESRCVWVVPARVTLQSLSGSGVFDAGPADGEEDPR